MSKMKLKYLITASLVSVVATIAVNAQEGFGTNNPAPSSVVDMVASDKGVLLPCATWHIAADYKNCSTSDNSNWTIYCLIINNTVVKSVGTVTANLGGAGNGSAAAPAGL